MFKFLNLKRKKILLQIEVDKLNKQRRDIRSREEIMAFEMELRNKIEEIKRVNETLTAEHNISIKILESNIEVIKWLRK